MEHILEYHPDYSLPFAVFLASSQESSERHEATLYLIEAYAVDRLRIVGVWHNLLQDETDYVRGGAQSALALGIDQEVVQAEDVRRLLRSAGVKKVARLERQ
jgi:hypothetical protein